MNKRSEFIDKFALESANNLPMKKVMFPSPPLGPTHFPLSVPLSLTLEQKQVDQIILVAQGLVCNYKTKLDRDGDRERERDGEKQREAYGQR